MAAKKHTMHLQGVVLILLHTLHQFCCVVMAAEKTPPKKLIGEFQTH